MISASLHFIVAATASAGGIMSARRLNNLKLATVVSSTDIRAPSVARYSANGAYLGGVDFYWVAFPYHDYDGQHAGKPKGRT